MTYKIGDKYDPQYEIKDGCLRLPFGFEFWWCPHCFALDVRKHEVANGKYVIDDWHIVYTVKDGIITNIEVDR